VERRHVEIDALKAAGIVTVVLIHAMRSPWEPGVSAAEIWLGHATRFGVPAFLFASGFLYARVGPAAAGTTARRLRRVLLPYVVASLLAQAWNGWHGLPSVGGSWWMDLLLGSSFGPFYYVFVATGLVLATPVFARLPVAALPPLTALLVLAQWCVDAAVWLPLPLYWHLRSPLLWWAFFLVGWTLRLHAAAVADFVAKRRRALLGVLLPVALASTVASGLEGELPQLLVRSAAWLDVWAILGLLFVGASRVRTSPAALRALSDASYAIYLFHLFFVYGVRSLVPPAPDTLAPLPLLLPWAAGLAGPLLLVRAARIALGPRARDFTGA
jgi:surface polysaccharide O-acyltransferase-like enzyme